MRYIILFLGLTLMLSCQTRQPVSTEKIDKLEAKMRALDHLDTALATNLVQEYEAYAKGVRNDSMAAVMLYREANVLKEMSAEHRKKALTVLEELEKKYPRHELAPRAAFMRAFVYDESLQRKEKAAELYDEFVEKYPEHPLARDAKLLKDMALKTEQQQMDYIKKMVEQSKQDSATKN